MTSYNVLICPQPYNIQFLAIVGWVQPEISTFKEKEQELEQENFDLKLNI